MQTLVSSTVRDGIQELASAKNYTRLGSNGDVQFEIPYSNAIRQINPVLLASQVLVLFAYGNRPPEADFASNH